MMNSSVRWGGKVKHTQRQQKRADILFSTCTVYAIGKAGKPFTDFELMCEIQAKNDLDIGWTFYLLKSCSFHSYSGSCLIKENILLIIGETGPDETSVQDNFEDKLRDCIEGLSQKR